MHEQPFQVTEGEQGRDWQLVLEGVVDVSTAASLQRALLPILERPANVTVECEHLERVDAAALQLLLALQQELQPHGHALRLHHGSSQLQDQLDLAGVAQAFAASSSGEPPG